MQKTSKSFVRSTALLLLIGLLALLAIVGTTIFLVERSQVYFDEVIDARIVRRVTVDLRSHLQDVETSQRGYIITRDDSYLGPYYDALPQVTEELTRLKELLSPFPEMADDIATLETNVAFKLREMAETIDLARSGNTSEAVARVRTDTGKQAMDEARTFFNGLIEAVDGLLTTGVANQRGTLNGLRWVSIIGGLVILFVVGGAMWTVFRYTGELARARRTIEEANEGLEERVKERTADLGKANEEIQRFAYIVTHDLRAPLVNIMGFTSELETSVGTLRDYMEDKSGDTDPKFDDARLAAVEDLPEAVTFIRAATRKMDGLINAILKISREGRRQLKPEPINLKELVDTAAASVHHQVTEREGAITHDIRVAQLVSDKFSIEQILGNMLDNAVKYSAPERPLAIAIRARQAMGNRIIIEVEDNGRGIADTDHERVFELFRRSGSQTQPGEGIGLAHVRTMARALGGDVTLRSTFGQGTTFIINLPRDLRGYLGSTGA